MSLRALPRFARGARSLGAEQRPLVYGHRGTCFGAKENTLAAMQLALEQGADGIELDVRLCKTGEVIVLHDPDLLRVAGVSLRADQASFEQLRAHDLGNGQRVPSLTEAIDLVLGFGAHSLLNVELKPDAPDKRAFAEAVASVLGSRAAEERARLIVSSFSLLICEAMVARLPEVPVAFLYEIPPLRLPRGIAALHPPHVLLDAAAIAQLHARGLLVNAWTVNDPGRARLLADAGVDGLITDDVPSVLSALRELA